MPSHGVQIHCPWILIKVVRCWKREGLGAQMRQAHMIRPIGHACITGIGLGAQMSRVVGARIRWVLLRRGMPHGAMGTAGPSIPGYSIETPRRLQGGTGCEVTWFSVRV